MPRKRRLQFNDAVYHIYIRGVDKRIIYGTEQDYKVFVELLSDLPLKFNIILHGYVLMANHFHLLVETPKANIAKTMHWLNGTYASYFNRIYGRVGHLFQGRYNSKIIKKEEYLQAVSRYIHRNPLKELHCNKLEDYRWSSFRQYIGLETEAQWLTTDWILARFSDNNTEARLLYKEFVEQDFEEDTTCFYEKETSTEKINSSIENSPSIEDNANLTKDDKCKLEAIREVVLFVINKVDEFYEENGKKIKEPYCTREIIRMIHIYIMKNIFKITSSEMAQFLNLTEKEIDSHFRKMCCILKKDRYLENVVWKIKMKFILERSDVTANKII